MLDRAAYSTILVDVDDHGIGVLTLSRPDRRNAVDDVMHRELSTVFTEAEADPRVGVVVLTGAGRAFSVGGDTSPDRAYASEHPGGIFGEARQIIESVIGMSKPLIAAVNGHAIGLGATLATLADVSFVARSATLGDPHVHAALPAGNGSAVIWPLLIGINRTKHLLLTGDSIPAAEAERLGLVTKVVDDGTALAAALDLAHRLAAMAPQAVRGTKRVVNELLRAVSSLVLPIGLDLEETAMTQPDFRAALERLDGGGRPSG